jgi:sigma-B regulation protein RsbU (phosphoserine phosphatase)
MSKSRTAATASVDVDADIVAGTEQVYDHLELLSAMGQDFASTRDLQASLMRAVQHITDYMGAEGGALLMLEDEGATLKCLACIGATEITGLTLSSDKGIVGRCVQSNTAEIVRDVQNDPNFNRAVDEETGFTTRSILCAPLSVKDERIGAIELINKRGGDGLFSDDDLLLLQAMSASAALAIHNARMAEALVEQERLARELELAAEIQRSLLPSPPGPGYPVSGVNIPARTVSGDFFDFFELDDGRICFNLGDVSGKGMNAALLMAKTASLYRCLGKTIDQPGRLLARVNAEICETATRGMFVTMVGGIYDPWTGIVRISNAGHEPPLFHDRDGGFTEYPAEAPPLGIMPPMSEDDEAFPESELLLDGGTFYIFTDGVTEGYVEGGQELTVEGLKEMLVENAGLEVSERLGAVTRRINRGEGNLRDDLTLLAIYDGDEFENRKRGPVDKFTSDDGVGTELISLRIPAKADRLKIVRAAVTQSATLSDCSKETIHDLVIAVDEALQNVIRHAYGSASEGDIDISIRRAGNHLIILIRDYAESIDVSQIKPRDLDDVRPGGLGTHFMREVMDKMEFLPSPDGKGNLLRMSKRIL